MEVVFQRDGARRYLIGLRRHDAGDRGADVPPRVGVGSGSVEVPHDLVHLAVEQALGLPLGIYGQLAAGSDLGGFFAPSPPDRKPLQDRRRTQRLRDRGHDDVALSESLAACVGHDGRLHRERLATLLRPAQVEAVQARLEELLAAWRATPPGEQLVVTWEVRPSASGGAGRTPRSRSTGRAGRGRSPTGRPAAAPRGR